MLRMKDGLACSALMGSGWLIFRKIAALLEGKSKRVGMEINGFEGDYAVCFYGELDFIVIKIYMFGWLVL